MEGFFGFFPLSENHHRRMNFGAMNGKFLSNFYAKKTKLTPKNKKPKIT